MIIIQDTREKIPWDFSMYDVEIEVKKINAGDYTLKGFESEIVIERKRSTGELAINLGSKRATFERELERMADIKNKYFIFEFSVSDILSFPKNSGIPEYKLKYIKMNPNYMIKLIEGYYNKYNIEPVYCSDHFASQAYVMELFNQYERTT